MKIKIRDLRKSDQYKIDDAYLNGYAKLCGVYSTAVYNSLSRHADFETQKCFPSLELIAKQHNISKPSVIKGIKKLEEWGIIEIVKEKDKKTGKQLPNIYQLIDKSEWVPKPKNDNRVNEVYSDKPGKPQNKNRVNEIDCKDTQFKDTHNMQNKFCEEFSLKKEIQSLREDKRKHIRLIGWYFIKRQMFFPDKKTLQTELRRWVKDAVFVSSYPQDKVAKAHLMVSRKFPDDWNLSTIRKYIAEV